MKSRIQGALGALIAVLALSLSGCNAESGRSQSYAPVTAPRTGGSTGDPVSSYPTNADDTSGGTSTAVGPSCSGAADTTCLGIRFVAYRDSEGAPTASPEQAATILSTMNSLFSTCKITFQIDHYDAVDPIDYGLSYGSQSQSETTSIRRAFSQPDELLAVTTGPWGTAVNAWTSMPGEGTYGAVMEAGIVDYSEGIIYAHEFGHYLGLDHVSGSDRLMSPVIYSSSTTLSSGECETAMNTALSYWSASIR